ncbi:MAG: metallophosphoesterase, partial [Clostridia bacterium]|nr:metallophosphoesterase [Clostridia bacterium]
MYNLWAFVRQSLIKAWLAAEKAVFKLSNGKYPKSLFCWKANPQWVGSKVKVLSEDECSTDIAKVDENGNITDDDFVIVSSTDFHIDTNHDLNYKTINYFVKHITDVKPDLVVLTGDIILSKFQQIDAIQFAQMMEKIGIYWTIVFGNHEVREEKGFYKYLMMKSFSDYPHCLAKHGPKELFGYGNYSIRIHGKNGKLRQALFMFDSGRDIREEYTEQYGLPKDIQGYDFIKKEQIDYYKSEVDSLRAKYGDFKSMAYMHIPIKEYELAFKADENGVYVPTGECEILYG